jgi:hypothetical protein
MMEQRKCQLEHVILIAPERWVKADEHERRSMATLAALTRFEGFRELARLLEMEE